MEKYYEIYQQCGDGYLRKVKDGYIKYYPALHKYDIDLLNKLGYEYFFWTLSQIPKDWKGDFMEDLNFDDNFIVKLDENYYSHCYENVGSDCKDFWRKIDEPQNIYGQYNDNDKVDVDKLNTTVLCILTLGLYGIVCLFKKYRNKEKQ